jgi:serine protease Do
MAAGAAIAMGVTGQNADAQSAEPQPRPAPAAPAPRPTPPPAATPVAPRALPQSQAQVQLSYAPVVRRTAPAVVNIYTAKVVRRAPMMDDPMFRFFFGERGGQGRERVERSLGSGVIVRPNGFIITNNHVIEGADQITVVLADRREFPATLVLADQRTDLAVLRINPGAKPLPAIELGDSDAVQVGDIVLAIGNPFGVGQTVTQGIVSASARSGLGITDFDFFIQTDASINRGNSGGALVDMAGRVIGINTAIFSPSGGSSGIGFAVPANMVRTVLNAATTSGRLVRPWLGIEGQPVDAELAKTLRLERPVGVLVNRVVANAPAARGGVRAGDVVFAVDGREVGNIEDLRARVATKGVGSTAVFTVIRNGAASNVTVPLAAPPETPPRQVTTLGGNTLFSGVQVGNLSPAFAQELGGNLPERGVVVLGIQRNAPAARFGLFQPGDVIEQINGRDVDTVGQVQQLAATSASGVVYRLNRQGQRAECGFRPPSQFFCRQ